MTKEGSRKSCNIIELSGRPEATAIMKQRSDSVLYITFGFGWRYYNRTHVELFSSFSGKAESQCW